jgi:hypothetical protein
MFTRLRWFVLGVASTIGAGVYLAGRVKAMRERITPETMARAGALTMAGMMEATGRHLQTGGTVSETVPGDPGGGEG